MPVTNQDPSYSKTQWIIGVVIIPLVFALIIGGLIWAVVAGNLSETAVRIGNSIPVVKNFVPDSETEVDTPSENNQLMSEIESLKQQLNEKDTTIQELQKSLDEKNLKIAEHESSDEALQQDRASSEERQKQLSDIADMYASMSASKAAPIISALTLSESSQILAFMDEDARANILSKMEPQRAADLSILLKDQVLSEDADIAALQERVKLLTEQLSEAERTTPAVSDIATTFNAMPAAGAAEILAELYDVDGQTALTILSEITAQQRSQILASMEPSTAATITRSLANQ